MTSMFTCRYGRDDDTLISILDGLEDEDGGLCMATDKGAPMRILHVIGAMDRGGAESLVMNIFRSIDRSKIQFDFLVHEERECAYDAEIRELGGSIYRVPRFVGTNYLDYRSRCRRFFADHNDYSVVHGHIGSSAAVYLSEARRVGIHAVAHSHGANGRDVASILFAAVSFPVRYTADTFFACSRQAGVDRFGQKVVRGPHFRMINNGIIINQYHFSKLGRSAKRRELGIDENAPLFCHVGRLVASKNHRFLLDAFSRVVALCPEARLVLVGGGELENELRRKTKELGISSHVLFLGVREDIPSILMASDVFVFPSLWEGLPLALVEAQASGLPCLVSSSVSSASKVSDSVTFLSLEKGPQAWATEMINRLDGSDVNRAAQVEVVRDAGFDIADTADKLSTFYRTHELW